LGGAHRDIDAMADSLRKAIIRQIKKLRALDDNVLLNRRYERLMSFGSQQQ